MTVVVFVGDMAKVVFAVVLVVDFSTTSIWDIGKLMSDNCLALDLVDYDWLSATGFCKTYFAFAKGTTKTISTTAEIIKLNWIFIVLEQYLLQIIMNWRIMARDFNMQFNTRKTLICLLNYRTIQKTPNYCARHSCNSNTGFKIWLYLNLPALVCGLLILTLH